MDDDAIEPREFSMIRMFPSLRLARGIGLAIDGRKMLLGALGILLTVAGWTTLNTLFGSSTEIGLVLEDAVQDAGSRSAQGLIPATFAELGLIVAEPILIPAIPFRALFRLGGGATHLAHALAATFWAVLVWGVVGAAIARITFVQVAMQDRIGLLRSLRFSLSKLRPLLVAPFGAFAAVVFFGLLCGLVGLLYRIPGPIGATIAGVLALLPLLAGVVMTLILVGLAAGWPLMVATIAAEGEDSFDALSRSYSYVYQRPVLYAFNVAVAWIIGAVGYVIVVLLARLVVLLAMWGLAFGGPTERIAALFGGPTEGPDLTAVLIHEGWMLFVALLVHGWLYSYFWSAMAQIYLLLRHDVDGAAFDDIALDSHASDRFAPEPPETVVEESQPPSAGPEQSESPATP